MKPSPIGTRIRPLRNSNDHHYTLGEVYTISVVRRRGFRAADASGKERDWLTWEDCELAPSRGWEFCQEVLAPEVIAFLRAFEGIESITLKTSIKDHILEQRQGLQEEILDAAERLRTRETVAAGEGSS